MALMLWVLQGDPSAACGHADSARPCPLKIVQLAQGEAKLAPTPGIGPMGSSSSRRRRYGRHALMRAGHDRRGVAINVKFSGEGSVKGEVAQEEPRAWPAKERLGL